MTKLKKFAKNNKNWMDLLRLSLTLDFKKTSKILKDIVSDDKKIFTLAKKIFGRGIKIEILSSKSEYKEKK